MASENGRLPEKQPDGTPEHGNAPQVKGETITALADADPASRSNPRADNKYNKWGSGIKNIFYKTNITDWLIVLFTGVLAFYTARLSDVASRQTDILDNTDKAIHEANLLNGGINRPWVAAKISIVPILEYDSANKSIRITMHYGLENTGASPAKYVNVYPYAFANLRRLGFAREECRRFRVSDTTSGIILFPKQTDNQIITVSVGNDEIENAPAISNNPRIKMMTIWISGCVDYRSTLDDQHHQTSFLLQLGFDKGTFLFDMDRPEEISKLDRSKFILSNRLTGWDAD